MIRRATSTALAVLLLACGSEGPGEAGGTDQTAPAPPAAVGTAPPSAEPVVGELPHAQAVVVQIFDEMAERRAPHRVTYHVLVARDATRDELRQTLGDLLTQQAERDEALVAARAIGYYGVQTGATEAEMVPFVWAEWLPPNGWYDATESSREALHRVYFYQETAPQW